MNLDRFVSHSEPYQHWVADAFIDDDVVRQINKQWPSGDEWRVKVARKAVKASLLFPARLPEVAQGLAEYMYMPETCAELGEIVGIELLPDPWFKDGPTIPRMGGGLHEIHAGGHLGMHLDFNKHPSGLTRCLNLLIYLNETWQESWGGALELHGEGKKLIYPLGGRAVMFRTTDQSWHGHPHPLTCPEGKSRRSLALYYYKRSEDSTFRPTTVYR